MFTTEKFDPNTIHEKRWPLPACIFMMDYAMTLLDPNHENYITNSKNGLFLRGAFSDERNELEIIKYSILELLNQPTNIDKIKLVSNLYKHQNISPTDKAAFWGLLIKDCLNKGDILDLNNPEIASLHQKLVEDLKTYINSPVNKRQIYEAFHTFFSGLIEAEPNGFEAFLFFSKFMEFYSQLLKIWDNEVGHNDPKFHSTPMLLGPGFFRVLRLNGALFDLSNSQNLVHESKFPARALDAYIRAVQDNQILQANAQLEALGETQQDAVEETIHQKTPTSLYCYETIEGRRSENRSPKKTPAPNQVDSTRKLRRMQRFYSFEQE